MGHTKVDDREYHYRFGHLTYYIGGNYFYADNDEPFDWSNPRACYACGEYKTDNGHDPCIAGLPGVVASCCGHGVQTGYIYFENGKIIDMVVSRVREKGCSSRHGLVLGPRMKNGQVYYPKN